jgi:hypothetical protein
VKIGFFVSCPEESVHWQIAKSMIASAKEVMPDVPIVQLTDDKTPELEGVSAVARIPGKMPMAIRRMKHHASCIGDWVFVDTDVIFQKDVSDVFEESFDVALTDRVGTYMHGTEYAKQQPYNMGVTFSRNTDFWKLVLDKLLEFPDKYQEWEGDQMVVCALAENQKTPFDIVIIPGKTYNFTPKTKEEDCSHAAIVHYKGEKKSWIK